MLPLEPLLLRPLEVAVEGVGLLPLLLEASPDEAGRGREESWLPGGGPRRSGAASKLSIVVAWYRQKVCRVADGSTSFEKIPLSGVMHDRRQRHWQSP